jgi:L-cysteine S-thiosulfotransferase
MKTYPPILLAVLVLALGAGCDSRPTSGRGFQFPAGDAARGQAAFQRLDCFRCHRVDGVAGLPAPTVAPEKVVVLGGEVHRLRSYGDLVTAVIHPSFSISEKLRGEAGREAMETGQSPMPAINSTMTVAEMLDIVTFLHPRYRQLEPLHGGAYGP